jgi:hypothetical protein
VQVLSIMQEAQQECSSQMSMVRLFKKRIPCTQESDDLCEDRSMLFMHPSLNINVVEDEPFRAWLNFPWPLLATSQIKH